MAARDRGGGRHSLPVIPPLDVLEEGVERVVWLHRRRIEGRARIEVAAGGGGGVAGCVVELFGAVGCEVGEGHGAGRSPVHVAGDSLNGDAGGAAEEGCREAEVEVGAWERGPFGHGVMRCGVSGLPGLRCAK